MSHWNHRVIKKTYKKGTEDEEAMYSVHEVFYNDAGEIYAYTTDPIDLSCESLDALKEYIQWCLNCLDKPVLVDGEVVFAKDDYDLSEDDLEELDKLGLTKEDLENDN
jgi:hypothetical protein